MSLGECFPRLFQISRTYHTKFSRYNQRNDTYTDQSGDGGGVRFWCTDWGHCDSLRVVHKSVLELIEMVSEQIESIRKTNVSL